MNTYQPKIKEINRAWHEIDAGEVALGRMASRIARLLMGKHKPTYSTHLDSGDFVVVVNGGRLRVSGKKEDQKVYYSHSGYPGGFKETAYKKLKIEQPAKIIEKAVSGMLPKNKLRKTRMRRLKVVLGKEHKYGSKKEN